MTTIEADPVAVIVARGLPITAGNKKPFRNQYTGRIQMVEGSKKAGPWRENVRDAALGEIACTCPTPACTDLREQFPLDQAVLVSMVFTMPKPTTAPKTRRTWPTARPDVVKLARSVEDSLTDAGLWRDDARVVEYVRLAKVFPGEDPDALPAPGVIVRVWRVDDVLTRRTNLPPAPGTLALFDPVAQL